MCNSKEQNSYWKAKQLMADTKKHLFSLFYPSLFVKWAHNDEAISIRSFAVQVSSSETLNWIYRHFDNTKYQIRFI
jgi:hypothetical protein